MDHSHLFNFHLQNVIQDSRRRNMDFLVKPRKTLDSGRGLNFGYSGLTRGRDSLIQNSMRTPKSMKQAPIFKSKTAQAISDMEATSSAGLETEFEQEEIKHSSESKVESKHATESKHSTGKESVGKETGNFQSQSIDKFLPNDVKKDVHLPSSSRKNVNPAWSDSDSDIEWGTPAIEPETKGETIGTESKVESKSESKVENESQLVRITRREAKINPISRELLNSMFSTLKPAFKGGKSTQPRLWFFSSKRGKLPTELKKKDVPEKVFNTLISAGKKQTLMVPYKKGYVTGLSPTSSATLRKKLKKMGRN